MAVQRDPLRGDGPLTFEEENAALAALQKLKVVLQREDLCWDNLSDVVEEALLNTLRGKITWRKPGYTEEEIFDWEKHPHHQNG